MADVYKEEHPRTGLLRTYMRGWPSNVDDLVEDVNHGRPLDVDGVGTAYTVEAEWQRVAQNIPSYTVRQSFVSNISEESFILGTMVIKYLVCVYISMSE